MASLRGKPAPGPLFAVLGLLLAGVMVVSVCLGTEWLAPGVVVRGAAHVFGLGEALGDPLQAIVELRLWRVLTAVGVGAALGLSGGLIQGMFRNGLASPSLLGVTSGASLGAAIAILLIGGWGPRAVLESSTGAGALLIPVFGFVGAIGTVLLVAFLASTRGRLSVTTLLLVGIAVNMCMGGIFAAIQSLSLVDWEVSRAIMAWTFGTLDDRSALHAKTVWTGLVAAALVVPFVGQELDLFKGGEDDANALGVSVGRVKALCLIGAALAASSAVAVAGQIAFVGLVVPHIVRLGCTARHAALLPLCIVTGALFLLGCDLAQRLVLGDGVLQPGVMMSLIGGPFFLFLLIRNRRELGTW